MQSFDLTQLGISGPQALRDLSPAILYEEAIRFDHKTSNSASGALVAPYSGSLFIWPSRTALRGILGGLGSDALPEFGL
jgi:hypothetical protein